ncbi:MAG: ion transporter [Xanthomonadales bacterium]|nr:ion transporter [Xanthomonadales bacterium]
MTGSKHQIATEPVAAELSDPKDSRSDWRKRLGYWIERGWPHDLVVVLIVLNAITIGLETWPAAVDYAGPALKGFENLVLAVFVVEIITKLIAFGPRFFRDGWNNLDFIIVAIALVPAAGPLSVLRSLRILRVLRLISTVPRLRHLTESLLAAIPSIGWISFMLGLVFYIFAVIGTELFGERFPDYFGHIGNSMYTLFQIMTLESWSMGIARPVMQEFPLAWLYFVPFILVSSFTILNLFIGIIVNTMQAVHWQEEDRTRQEIEQRAHDEREEMLTHIREMRMQLDRMQR